MSYVQLDRQTDTQTDASISYARVADVGDVAAETASMRSEVKAETDMSTKTTYQRSAKGPTAISMCSPDGKSITLENTGNKV